MKGTGPELEDGVVAKIYELRQEYAAAITHGASKSGMCMC
jgi:hypothetical protein